MKNSYICTLVILLLLITACSKSGINEGAVDKVSLAAVLATPTRALALLDYQKNYLGSALDSVGWTGNISLCEAGTSSQLSKTRLVHRLNYFRRLSGLPDSVTLNDSLSRMCQEAALMMESNNRLDHHPTPDWHCFSRNGQEAAAFSNLALGASGPPVIDLYIADAGLSSLGHRRWILFPPLTQVGTGDTPNANALWVLGPFGPPVTVPFVAYPGNGFVPAPLVFAQWSFSVSGADFRQAAVLMTDSSGAVIALTSYTTPVGCGENTIGWQPTSWNAGTLKGDALIHVLVTGVEVGGERERL